MKSMVSTRRSFWYTIGWNLTAGSKVMTQRLNITEKTFDRVNIKRWVITFDPTVSYQSITYEIEGIDETVILIYNRLKPDGRIKSYDSSFEFYRQNFWLGKHQTLSHNFWSDRQLSVYNIWNRRYRRDGRFDIFQQKTDGRIKSYDLSFKHYRQNNWFGKT